MYWNNAGYNSRVFTMFRQQIVGLALTRFRWVNMPKTFDARYFEWTLLTQGVATLAHPKSIPGGWYGTQVAFSGRLNVYDNPVRWRSIGNNGWRFDCDTSNGVIVWDNLERIVIWDWIDLYALELTDVLRTKQMNRMHQRIPYVITGDQTQRQDMLNLYKQVAGGEPAIIASNGLNTINVDTLDTKVEYIGDKLNAEWQNIWNQIYTMLGIENLPFKTERQIEDEVRSMTMPSSLMALNPLTARREALDKAKKLSNGVIPDDADVVWREDNRSANYNVFHNVHDYMEVMEDGVGASDSSPAGFGETPAVGASGV